MVPYRSDTRARSPDFINPHLLKGGGFLLFDYQPDSHFDRCYSEFIELLSVQIKTDFWDSLFFVLCLVEFFNKEKPCIKCKASPKTKTTYGGKTAYFVRILSVVSILWFTMDSISGSSISFSGLIKYLMSNGDCFSTLFSVLKIFTITLVSKFNSSSKISSELKISSSLNTLDAFCWSVAAGDSAKSWMKGKLSTRMRMMGLKFVFMALIFWLM